MRQAEIFVNDQHAGILIEFSDSHYEFIYDKGYQGHPVSLTLPLKNQRFQFTSFPPFFEGLLPEGVQLEALLRQKKINRNDHFSQLVATGDDFVGAITVKELR